MSQIKLTHLLLITIQNFKETLHIIKYARLINPNIIIVARVRQLEDQIFLTEAGAEFVYCDEIEVRKAICQVLSKLSGNSYI